LLLSASIIALMTLIALDWKVWLPARLERARAFERWLAIDVLGNPAPPPDNWTTLEGKFRGRDISISRSHAYGMRGLRWRAKTKSELDLKVVRLDIAQPLPPPGWDPANPEKPPEPQPFSSGDDDFETLYAWQSHKPDAALPLLKNAEIRASLKRLASLVAQRGVITHADNGITVSGGTLDLLQAPAPDISTGAFQREEALAILHDLTILAGALEGQTPPPESGNAAINVVQGDPLSAWLALGCFGMGAVLLWMGLTWGAAHFVGLASAMVVFFIPPVLLAFLFMLGQAGGSGRQAELDEFIRKESVELVKKFEDLRSKMAG
ncbi:MAG TPA: hypothetical protein VEK08_02665, partial [Planctomycetota bacterium]|nr:hypothetical protein [Planctomycetota bacterium]